MKSLDEVIEAIGRCWSDNCFDCPYHEKKHVESCTRKRDTDAIHYLQEYSRLQTAYIKAMADLEDNPPLTWDELRTMESKPVWVENQFYKRWLIAYKVNREDIIFDGNGFYTQAFSVDYGKAWQAYRKERK